MSSDSAAVDACLRGDLTAFDDLYRAYVGPIYGYIHRRVSSRAIAEDLTSTTFLKAMERISTFDPDRGAFVSWLYAIARNVIIDHLRAERPKVSIEDAWTLSSDDDPVGDAVTSERRDEIRAALDHLTPQQREIVLLRLWEGLSYREIAELLDLTEGNCKVIFHRAVQSLKQTMSPSALALFLLLPHLP